MKTVTCISRRNANAPNQIIPGRLLKVNYSTPPLRRLLNEYQGNITDRGRGRDPINARISLFFTVPNFNNNLYFKRVTPITMKSILPSGPPKTKLIIINSNNHDKKPIYK